MPDDASHELPTEHSPKTEPELVDRVGIRVIPPVAYTLCLIFGFGLNAIEPKDHIFGDQAWHTWVGLPLMVVGLAFALWGIRRFQFHNVDPHPNTGAKRLVLSGAYKYSRNPMYVGLLTLHIGLILLTQNYWLLITWPFLLLYLRLYVIRREEKYLLSKFGPEYAEFCRRVRRWL